jgi:hypothetical protein
MSEEASTRDGPQQLYLERGTISGCLHPFRLLTPFEDAYTLLRQGYERQSTSEPCCVVVLGRNCPDVQARR